MAPAFGFPAAPRLTTPSATAAPRTTRRGRPVPALAALAPALLLAACQPALRARPALPGAAPAAVQVYDSQRGRVVPWSALVDRVAGADVVFFGEQHDDPATHAAEMAVLASLGERRPAMVLSLEMFERDVQGALNDYLAGRRSETEFLAASRPWDRYATDYRPLVELARTHGWPVVAANVPRRLASGVSRRGLAMLDTLNATDRGYMARDHQCPMATDAYYVKFAATMTGHSAGGGPPTAADAAQMRAMTDRFYQAQCVKDEAMAEAIAEALGRGGRGTLVLHVNGAFHSDEGLGTAERVRRRAPGAKVVVLSAVPVPDPLTADGAAHRGKGDFILLARAPKK